MSALQFLNKKSWHTATLKNNEKVWLAEQKAEEEKKRIDELRKQLEDERHFQELRRLQVQSGQLDPSALKQEERVEWLYEWGKDKDEEEQYLLGKKSADTLLSQKGKEEEEDRLKKLTQGSSQSVLSVGLNRLDTEAKLREDPLMEIKRKELEAIQAIRSNPVKMEKLRREREQRQRIELSRSSSHRNSNSKHEERRHKRSTSREDRKSSHSYDRKEKVRGLEDTRRHPSGFTECQDNHKRRRRYHASDDYSRSRGRLEENRTVNSNVDITNDKNGRAKSGYGLFVPNDATYHGWNPEKKTANGSSIKPTENSKSQPSHITSEFRKTKSREELLQEMQQDALKLEQEKALRTRKYKEQEVLEEQTLKSSLIEEQRNFLFQVASDACNLR
eukprot:jgi/Galph1/158/GphlegSOOS_G4998.1